MEPDRRRTTSAERSNLIAFLDGELSGDDSRAVALTLAQSPIARRESDAFRQTWNLLDLLPAPKASPELKSRTLSRVGEVSTLDERLVRGASRIASNLVPVFATVGAAVGVLALGFALARWAWPDPTAHLARDLTIAEHLDEYRAVGSVEFLRELDESTEFNRLVD